MNDASSLIFNHIDNLEFFYVIDSVCPYLLQSGLIFTTKSPSRFSLPSTPFPVCCLAPKFYRGRATRSRCKREISDIGPYCREHCILYQTLDVRPSSISTKFRGLFACASTLNITEIRHQRSLFDHEDSIDNVPALRQLTDQEMSDITQRKSPVFYARDVIGYFGGIFGLKTQQEQGGALDPNHPASYVILYKIDDKEILIDGCIESSGVARFSNSIIRTKSGKTVGEEYLNATMEFGKFKTMKIDIGGAIIDSLPCLVASRDIYDGEEIITDYNSDYWTKEMIQELPIETQNYLKGLSNKKPLFLESEQVAE